MKRKKSQIKNEYIVGFVDGEGTFNIVKYPDGRIRPQFLVFNTNRKILEKIKLKMKLKAPILEVCRTNDGIKRNKKMYRLQVRAMDDIKKVVMFFEKYKPIVKKKDYLRFKRVYENWIKSKQVSNN